eukprot:TRINITY_DN21996_c0_g1_i1.p1 TRINITY_DN21996_c0_g1~~TRINITY_DN21996_c0_g1_i1.p1  ORF type:complete len:277 (+),score=32.57 TRINITY_DN21996_c0_g1_i1:67-897(+)
MDKALAEISAFISSLEDYDCRPAMDSMRQDYVTPVVTVCAYLMLVFVGPMVFKNGVKGSLMKALFASWNLLLGLFSMAGFYYCAVFLIREIADKQMGLQDVICSDDMIFRVPDGACYSHVGFAATAFTLSKFVELGDTVFLVVMGKPVIFLHWYHHASVLMYCWVAFSEKTPSALTFGTMNYGVHSVMYCYYALSQYTTLLRPLRPLITSLQLLQMAIGTTVVGLSLFYTLTSSCSATYTTWYFSCCGIMYFSYGVLFLKLFYNSYIKRSPKVKKT